MDQILLDPTPEITTTLRRSPTRLDTIDGVTIGLLDISKPRGDIYLDELEVRLAERGATIVRYRKPTHARPAPPDLRAEITEQCTAVIEALAD